MDGVYRSRRNATLRSCSERRARLDETPHACAMPTCVRKRGDTNESYAHRRRSMLPSRSGAKDSDPILAITSNDKILCDAAREHASGHRDEIQASGRCGCYFCFHTFPNTQIKVWIDANQTALCPACGLDAVIGDASKHRLDDKFLRQMHTRFFSSTKR